MSLLHNKLYFAVVLGHFTIDVVNNIGPVLVTFISIPLGLSPAQIGLAIGAYQFSGSASQPFFGWLVDKFGSRWLGPGSVAWTAGFMTLAVFAVQQSSSFFLFLIPFVLSSLGSSTFHPLGVKHAAEESEPRAATGTGIFFGFGQTGLAAGPILTGVLLSSRGLSGIYLLTFGVVPLIIFLFYAMRHATPDVALATPTVTETTKVAPTVTDWTAIGVLALLIGLRSWAFLGTITFLPKIFQDLHWSAASYGLITGTFWIASAISGAVAGSFADRWGRRQVVFLTLVLGSIALYFLPLYDTWQAFPLAIISGGLLGASHSILVVIAQNLLPVRKALASGITLGYLFSVGAMAGWGIGAMAGTWRLTALIQVGSGIGILSALLALFLPRTRTVTPMQVEGMPAS